MGPARQVKTLVWLALVATMPVIELKMDTNPDSLARTPQTAITTSSNTRHSTARTPQTAITTSSNTRHSTAMDTDNNTVFPVLHEAALFSSHAAHTQTSTDTSPNRSVLQLFTSLQTLPYFELQPFENTLVLYQTKIHPVQILDGGMGPFYRLSRNIMYSGFGSEYPYGFAERIREQTDSSYKSNSETYIPAGFVLGIFFGCLLFLVYFVLFMSCFPCCLFCSYCCQRPARMKEGKVQPLPNQTTIQGFGAAVLVIGGVMGLTLVCLVLKSHEHIGRGAEQTFNALRYALFDFEQYLDVFLLSVLHIFDNLNITSDAVLYRFDRVGSLMGTAVRQGLNNKTGIDEALKRLKGFGTTATNAKNLVVRLKANIAVLVTDLQEINKKLVLGGKTPIPITQPSWTTTDASITAVSAVNFEEEIDRGIEELQHIPDKVRQASVQPVADMKATWKELIDDMNQFRNTSIDIKNNTLRTLDVKGLIDKINATEKEFHDLDPTGMLDFLVSMDMISVLMLGFGAGLTCYAYWTNYASITLTGVEKDWFMSTSTGGHFMYGGLSLFVVFGWFWMIVSVFLYIYAGAFDVITCKVVGDPEFKVLDELVENRNLFGEHKNGTFLGSRILGMPNSTLTVGTFMKDCKKDVTLFQAAHLDKHPKVNFTGIVENLIKNMNLTSQMDRVTFNIGQVDALTSNVTQYLATVSTLNDTVPFASINKLGKVDVDSYVGSPVPSEAEATLTAIKTKQREISQDSKSLQEELERAKTTRQDVISDVRNAQTQIAGQTRTAIHSGAEQFADHIKGILFIFTKTTLEDLLKRTGKCGIIYDVYSEVIIKSLCQNLANVVNGLWLAIGWLHVNMLFAIVLTIHLNRQIPAACPEVHLSTVHRMSTGSAGSGPGHYRQHQQQPKVSKKVEISITESSGSYTSATSATSSGSELESQRRSSRVDLPRRSSRVDLPRKSSRVDLPRPSHTGVAKQMQAKGKH